MARQKVGPADQGVSSVRLPHGGRVREWPCGSAYSGNLHVERSSLAKAGCNANPVVLMPFG